MRLLFPLKMRFHIKFKPKKSSLSYFYVQGMKQTSLFEQESKQKTNLTKLFIGLTHIDILSLP